MKLQNNHFFSFVLLIQIFYCGISFQMIHHHIKISSHLLVPSHIGQKFTKFQMFNENAKSKIFNFLKPQHNDERIRMHSKPELIQTKKTIEPDDDNSFPIISKLNEQGYSIMILLFFVTLLGALDRVAMSVAVIPMANELNFDESTKGIIAGMFSIGYMFGLLPSGLIGTFSSPKTLLSFGVVMWSIAQMASPYFANVSLPALYLCRFLMGVAESCIVPTVQSFVARWVPSDERSKILGFVLSGFQLGTVGAYYISPKILDALSWPGVFLLFGAVGFLWIAFWTQLAQDIPTIPTTSSPLIPKSLVRPQFAPIIPIIDQKLLDYSENLESIPWKQILTSKQVYSIAIAHSVQNFGLYINLAWLPTYFYQTYGLSVDQSSLFSVGPWIGGAILGSVAGYLADDLVNQGKDKTFIRKLFQSVALLTPAFIMYMLSISGCMITATTASFYFIGAISAAAVCVGGFGSSVQDICKSSKLTPIIYGITSVPAVLMGSFGVYITGVVLDNYHDWNIIFQGTAIIYCLGALFYSFHYEATKTFE